MEFAVFIGRFHPLVVHLPIGFLLLATLMWGLSQWNKTDQYEAAISLGLLVGTISAAMACLMGYLLSLEGGYEATGLDRHMWAGIVTTCLSGGMFLLFRYRNSYKLPPMASTVLLLLVCASLIVAGHLGGNLTHGETYLTEYLPFSGPDSEPLAERPKELSEVEVFRHVVQPMLEAKCVSCHGNRKRKGGLSLADRSAIEAGGKHGAVWVAGKASESELIKRINLPTSHDKLMPPKGKTPLSEEEKDLLSWWINQGAAYDLRLAETKGEEAASIQAWVAEQLELTAHETLPSGTLALSPISPDMLATLRNKGFIIREMGQGTNLMDVTFPVYNLKDDYKPAEVLTDLAPIADHIMWLNLAGLGLTDGEIQGLAAMKSLEKLRLEKNQLTHECLSTISKMPKLRTLNIYRNPVGNEGIAYLQKISTLERVYAWQTQMDPPSGLPFEIIR